jgi:cysteine-rich repeat protein
VRLANGQFATVWYDHGLAVGLIAALCPPATAVCGDGVRAAACEQCDDGAANSDTAADACRTSCRLPSCGDGAVDSAEECDDGNAGACDGCSPTCTVEPGYACGDGVRSAACGEECDAGAANSDSLPDACRGDCTLSRCGDGVTDAGEACDDGNQQSCDGCTFDCRREAELADANGNGIADICDACRDFLAPVAGTAAECIPLVNSAVSQAQRARFATGAEEFLEVETPASGLGPVFNGASCAECHNRPVIGGSSARMVTRIGAQNAGGQFDALETHGGPLLQDQGIETPTCSEAGEVVPPEATIVAQRNAPALFGLGLLEAIPRQQIDRLVDTSDRNGDGISGRPGFGGAGRLGRFGWKAQVASAHDFAVGAYLDEMGITSPYAMSENNPQGQAPLCDAEADPEDDGNAILAFTEFMQLLAEPPATAWSREARRGRSVFKKVKCHKCHVDRYRTRDVPIAALRNRRVRAYTDLLLHNMGPVLADGIRQGNAEGYEFRTPPLWGVRHSAPYLHDGRAATIEDAIVAHGGEAQAARDNFLALPLVKRQQLIAFLNAL